MTKKVNRMSFFSDISRKKFALMPIYLKKKNVHSLKNTALMPIFCRKNVHSFRNTVLLCEFCQNFHLKPLAVMPIFDQKRQFYQTYTIL